MQKHRLKHTILAGAMALLMAACTQVELCYVDQHPHTYGLQVLYQWADGQQPPRRMQVIAARVVDVCRYLFEYDTQTRQLWRTIYYPGVDQPTEYTDSLMQDTDSVARSRSTALRVGFYDFYTLNANDSLYLLRQQEFFTESTRSIQELRVANVTYTQPVMAGRVVQNWPDMNAKYPYVAQIGPIYKDHLTRQVHADADATLEFQPQPLSQHLTFELQLQCDSDVVVEGVTAEVSGVVASQQLATGYVDMDATQSRRILFGMATSAPTGTLTCTGSVDVLGLINSYDKSLRSGPGILYIGVTARATNRQTGQVIRKTCFAQLNLYPLIEEQPLLQPTDRLEHYELATHEAVLRIQEALPITYDELMGQYDNQGRLDQWVKHPEYGGLYIEI